MTNTFTIKIYYFKLSGKLYASENFTGKFEHLKDNPNSIYMYPVVDWIRNLRTKKELPGLAGGWDGYILVDCEAGYPHLVLPEG